MNKLNDKILEYVDRFQGNVPVFQLPSMTAAEMIRQIDVCLKTGKPFTPDTDPDKIY